MLQLRTKYELFIAIYNLTAGMHIPLYSFVVERVTIWMVNCSKEQRPKACSL